VADMLFATLETKTRKWNLEGGLSILLSDTVGFVRDLPHRLVASFKATLEEAIGADLLIHVADASHDRVEHEIEAVEAVLDELGCDPARVMLAMNKIDKIADPTVFTLLGQKYSDAVFVSAVTGRGADKLVDSVAARAGGGSVRVKLHAQCTNGKLMQYIAQYARVVSQTYEGTIARIDATMAANRLPGLKAFGNDVKVVAQ